MPKQKKIIRTKRIYKKRSRPKWFGSFLFVLLLLLLVGLGYLVGRQWFGQFGGDGTVSSAPPSSESTVSEPPVSSETASAEASSEAAPEPKSAPRAASMSAADMLRTGDDLSAYFQGLSEAGYNAVCIELKTEQGVVTYQTANELALQYGAVSTAPADLSALVTAAKAAGLAPVAKISALKDPLAPHVSRENSYGYQNSSEVNWLDDAVGNGGKPWLNPYMENTRKYIAGLCAEAAGKGFETILLTNVTFPTKNATQSMGTLNEFTSREKILGQLVEESRAAAGGAEVYASYDVTMLLRYGLDYVRGLGPYLAPMVDLSAIEANRKALTALMSPSAAQPLTAEEIAAAMLGEAAAVRMDGGDRLPMVPARDAAAVEPLLVAGGYEGVIIY